MTCGLAGVVIYRGVISALRTIPANGTMLVFCFDESHQLYDQAFNELSSPLQAEVIGGENGFVTATLGLTGRLELLPVALRPVTPAIR